MVRIKHLSRRFLRYCWTSFAIAIILFAFLVSITRMLIPLLSDYQADIEALASEQIGRPVSISSISAEWIGFWPRIHLSGIAIKKQDGKQKWLGIDDVWISVNFLSLIRDGRLDAEQVKIRGLSASVNRKSAGQFIVNNESFYLDQSGPQEQKELMKWIFSRDKLQIVGSRLQYQDGRFDAPKVDLANVRFTLENDNGKHQVYGGFSIDGKQESQLSFVLHMQGDMLKPQEVLSRLYVESRLFVSKRLRSWLKKYIHLQSGKLAVQAWGQGRLARLDKLTVKLDANDLAWSVPGQTVKGMNSVGQLSASVYWKRRDKAWTLDIEDLQLEQNQVAWPGSDIRIAYQSGENDSAIVEGTMGFLRLGDLGGLLKRNLPDTIRLKKHLRALRLRGDLHDIRFSYDSSRQQNDNLYLQAGINNLGFDRNKGVPGVSGLDGLLVIDGSRGRLSLDSHDTELDFGKLFLKPLFMDEMKGDIHWHINDTEIAIGYDKLLTNNKHFQLSTRASIKIPTGKGSTFVDLTGDFKNGKAEFARYYIPQTMNQGSQSWLDKAFVKGRASSGKVILHGEMARFPFKQGRGTFFVDFDVEGLELNYGNSWPRMRNVNAQVVFQNDDVDIKISSASIQGNRLAESTAHITQLSGKARLKMNMSMQGKTRHFLAYLYKSPIASDARDFLSSIKTSGQTRTQANIEINLANVKEFSLKGESRLIDSDFTLGDWKQHFRRVQGTLRYAYDGKHVRFSSNKFTMGFHGRPASMTVNTWLNKKRKPVTTLKLKTNQTVNQLLAEFVKPPKAIFKGASDWVIKLSFMQKGQAELQLQSKLNGTAIKLPDGFAKNRVSRRTAQFTLGLKKGLIDRVRLKYGDKISAVAKLKHEQGKIYLERADMRLGGARAYMPKTSGYSVRGTQAVLSPEKWQELFLQESTTSADSFSVLDRLQRVDLRIKLLKRNRYELRDIALKLRRKQGVLKGNIKARELAGSITVPQLTAQSEPVHVKLDYLYVKSSTDRSDTSLPDPRELPDFVWQTNKLYLNGSLIGNVLVRASREPQGMKIEKIAIRGRWLNVDGWGSWLFKNSWHESAMELHATTPKIDQAMKLFKYKPTINEASVDAHLKANWAGPPHWFEVKRMDGSLKVEIKKGRLSEIDPGGGRIFGLLNVDSIRRRLSLDFSDLFKKGFGFDIIKGSFIISDGDAYTNNLFLDGPAARIDIQGRIGLAAEDYNQKVKVTPKISSSLPILGLAGGPQVAAGIYLTEKLFRKKINKMTFTEYEVTGSWEKPVVRKITTETQQEEEQAESGEDE